MNPLHIDLDRRVVIDDRRGSCRLRVAKNSAHRADQVPQLHFANRLTGRIGLPRWQVAGQPRIVLLPVAAAAVEHAGGVFVLSCIPAAARQADRGIVQRFGFLAAAGKNRLRLYFDRHAGQFQKIANFIDIELLQHFQVGQVLLGDQGNRQIADIQLVLADQK